MRTLLFILISFVGLTAAICGLLMISYPDGRALGLVPDILEGTFFNNFLIPGIILAIVGSINVAAVFSNMQRSNNRYNWSLAGGVLISGWIIAETILIPAIHWLQFIYLVSGILIILISYQLKGKWAV